MTAIHPVEFINIQLVYIAPMFLLDLHAAVYIFYIMYIYYHGIVDHSGINFKVIIGQNKFSKPPRPTGGSPGSRTASSMTTITRWGITSNSTTCCPQYFHVNFGFNVELWDRLHGTIRQKDKIYR